MSNDKNKWLLLQPNDDFIWNLANALGVSMNAQAFTLRVDYDKDLVEVDVTEFVSQAEEMELKSNTYKLVKTDNNNEDCNNETE